MWDLIDKWVKIFDGMKFVKSPKDSVVKMFDSEENQVVGSYNSSTLDIASEIINLEMRITRAIINGHKPTYDDEYQKDRERLKILRCQYFGEYSDYCRKNRWD